ncbi:MAG: nucleotidyltransferase domain-containing protein [Pseudomonadota bacterium]
MKTKITKHDLSVLQKFAALVWGRFPSARIWMYGSRARGDSSWDSDFDVCIILERVDSKIDRWIRDIAWQVGFENDRVITTLVFDIEQFEHGPISESTLIDNILKQGVAA